MTQHNIYWWNLENLFDIENSPRRSELLNKTLKNELKGWTQDILDQKLSNLVSIIKKLNTNNGPDILGVCEVENNHVVSLLADKLNAELARNYGFVIVEGEDKRGIDTALLYDKNVYTQVPKTFTLRLSKRRTTRDLFQVQLTTASGNDLVLILNHWPSRSGGVYESEPFRIMVGETLSYWVHRIHEELGDAIPIVLMGDFNDNPHDRSMTNYLQSTNTRKRVLNARNHLFYNLMFPFLDDGIGTYVFGSEVNILDQFLISKSIVNNNPALPFKLESVEIVNFPEMVKGNYNRPIKFSRPSKGTAGSNKLNLAGFSDHLPIGLCLAEN